MAVEIRGPAGKEGRGKTRQTRNDKIGETDSTSEKDEIETDMKT